jgi:hypothetical protein
MNAHHALFASLVDDALASSRAISHAFEIG